jgi:hypothetical protein
MFLAFLHYEEGVNSQQSTVNSQQSTVNSQQSTVNSQQSKVKGQNGFRAKKPMTLNLKPCPTLTNSLFLWAKEGWSFPDF